MADEFERVPGLGAPTDYGDPVVNVPDIPMVDEQSLSGPPIGRAARGAVPVDDPVAIVRAATSGVLGRQW